MKFTTLYDFSNDFKTNVALYFLVKFFVNHTIWLRGRRAIELHWKCFCVNGSELFTLTTVWYLLNGISFRIDNDQKKIHDIINIKKLAFRWCLHIIPAIAFILRICTRIIWWSQNTQVGISLNGKSRYSISGPYKRTIKNKT